MSVESKLIQMAGGLDLASMATLIKPGFALDAYNYEIDSVNGGYARINGYERFDGRPSPTDASYWIIGFSGTVPAVGATITGGTSTHTAKVLAVVGSTLVIGRATGTFTVGESLGGGTTAATVANLEYETVVATHADYKALAADDLRNDIAVVPGSGPVRGVHLYNGTLYAVRDNAGATAGVLHKATVSGWSAVTMYSEITFDTGLVKTPEGTVLYGATGVGTVKRILTRTGSWGSTAAGTIVIQVTSGAFVSGEALKITSPAGVTQMTARSVAVAITLPAGGAYEFINYNFTGSTDTLRMYGVNGVGTAFEFDGTVFCPIRTGMTTDTPSHIAAHNSYLFLSFRGSLQNSAIGDPYGWSLTLGASEIGVGDTITALLPMPGDVTTAAMHIFCEDSTHTLYGKVASSWEKRLASPTSGAYAGTAQVIGSAYVLSVRGVQNIASTDVFGDFLFASESGLIQPLINRLNGTAVASAAYKARNQYRIFYSDGSALATTIIGKKTAGTMYIKYPNPVVCYTNANASTGEEVSYFGSTDGYVYRDNYGTSFDGADIEAFLRLPFGHLGSPRYRKRFRRLILDMTVSSFATVSVSYDLGSGSSNVLPGTTASITEYGSGGYWDQLLWDDFTWDAQAVINPSLDLTGTEKNISVLFYSNSDRHASHAIQGVTINYTLRRLER